MTSSAGKLELADITSQRIHRLVAYWTERRAARGALPRRADIAPDQIRDLLPHIMIVDVEHNPLRFRYRLVGTRVVEYNGFEFTGRYLGEIGWPEEQQLLEGYKQLVEVREPVFAALDWELVSGHIGRFEFVRLPLSEDGLTVSQVLSMEDYDFPHPDDAVPSGGEPKR